MNPTKTLREVLKISQQQLAIELGISIGSIRAYEAGARVSEASLERMKSLAVSHGLGDLAMQMAPGNFEVDKVFSPADRRKSIRLRGASHGRDMSDDLHEALDVILNKGTADAVGSVDFLLRTIKEQVEAVPLKKGKK